MAKKYLDILPGNALDALDIGYRKTVGGVSKVAGVAEWIIVRIFTDERVFRALGSLLTEKRSHGSENNGS